MINYSTPIDELKKELFEEEGRAIYWLKKSYHGEKGYERMRDNLLMECNRTKKTQISEVVEYISQKGNRWMAFECCQYYKGAGHSNTAPMAFCYYETYGSVGAYMVGHGAYDMTNRKKTIIHFTNHFFLRFCQRLGVEMRSRWMVQRFVEVIPGFLFGPNGFDEYGRQRVDVRLPGSIGRGILKDDIIEIKSYLTDKELNGKQLRETEKLRKSYDMQTFEPVDVRMNRLAHSNDFSGDMAKEIENVSNMTGIDNGTLVFATNLRMFLTEAIIDLGYVRADDKEAWKRIGMQTADVDFFSFAEGYENNIDKAKHFYELICEVGERSGIKGYDPVAVTDKTIEIWTKAVKDYEK